MRNKLLLFSLLLALSACRREEDPALSDLGYSYFPLEVGKYVIYSVTEIDVDAPISRFDTTRYQIKEKLESVFTDNAGQPCIRVERYRRPTPANPWVINDVWYFYRNERNAQKVEENERFIRLSFPINYDARWNGNAFLPADEWIYRYENIGVSYSNPYQTFSKTVEVNQRFRYNFVEYENCREIYADGIGMVYKQYIVTTINNGDSTSINRGKLLHQYAIDYGLE
ncbi:MAG TPA: hypothetical protein PK798_11140 [Flavobacteriales bacterium]|nr:hypothetical protein [Flavobacteriales bacterium]HRJ35228.1 hypothetical protein [Flavobacteriales bacterium]HRJ39336.1 hypothetical protein [Flavobacteriales bacterium]